MAGVVSCTDTYKCEIQTTSTCAFERGILGVEWKRYVKATKHDTNFSGHQPRQFKDEVHACDPLILSSLRLADRNGIYLTQRK